MLKIGNRFLNTKGEYCIIKYIIDNTIKLQICGKNSRIEPWETKVFNRNIRNRNFIKIPFPKTDRTNIGNHLMEYQLNIIGKTTVDTKENENWFTEWTITEKEHDIFKNYALYSLKKVFKFNNKKAKESFNWFIKYFGLKIKN
jgi:hypothetical protein